MVQKSASVILPTRAELTAILTAAETATEMGGGGKLVFLMLLVLLIPFYLTFGFLLVS